MPRECAESGCPNQTDSGLCRECSAERKYGTDSRAYNPDGSRKVQLRDTETRDDDQGHAEATLATLANADDADLEAAGIDPEETSTEWRCPDCGERRKTYDGESPDSDCLTCGDATEWVSAEKEVRCDGGHEPIENRRWIETKLRACRFVEWDRFTIGEWSGKQAVSIYGWIDRDDDYKDFVVVICWPESKTLYHITSSSAYTEELTRKLHGDTDDHNECNRVEHTFNVSNAVEETDDDREIRTDGGEVRCEHCDIVCPNGGNPLQGNGYGTEAVIEEAPLSKGDILCPDCSQHLFLYRELPDEIQGGLEDFAEDPQ